MSAHANGSAPFLDAVLLLLCAAALFCACDNGGGTTYAGAGDGGGTDTGVPDAAVADAGTDAGADAGQPVKLTSLVDPFIGTGGVGFGVGQTLPGPAVPFGMVKAGPDTTEAAGAAEFYHCGGYYRYDPYVLGFSHLHLSGVGTADLGNILFMPVVGMDEKKIRPAGYRAPLDHSLETAAPGYYAVTLADRSVRAEITAAARAAIHRYSFASGDDQHVLIDVAHMASSNYLATDGHVTIDAATSTVSGDVLSRGSFSDRWGGIRVWFHAVFSKPVTDAGTWVGAAYQAGTAAAAGDGLGAYVGFGPSDGTPLLARVGISYIGAEQAKINVDNDIPAFDFDAVRAAADAAWEKELSIAVVEGGTATERKMFYTALYHVMQHPTNLTEAGGKYFGFDKQAHDAAGFDYYTDFSMWDTYRTLMPLLTLIAPDRTKDMITSLIMMYEQGGAFPRWPMGTGESGSMVGDSFAIIIADAYVKGVRGFDVETAWQGILNPADGTMPPNATYGGRGGLQDYLSLGYVTADKNGGSVSVTQEYCFDDFAIAQFAGALGKTADRDRFLARAQNYRNLFHPDTKFFRGKNSDGTWVADFTETGWKDYYVEGDAWQYRFFVPFDVPGLSALFGGPAGLVAALDDLFAKSLAEHPSLKGSPLYPNYYWQGNEPDIHTAYLYVEAGRPDLAQQWARWVARDWYGADPDGVPGNDDCGTMSAWLAFTSMGFYPVPSRDIYLVGSPVFSKVTLALKGGTLVVEAPGASRSGKYVQSATFNGKPLDKPWFTHTDAAKGATLHLEMGETASDWGKF